MSRFVDEAETFLIQHGFRPICDYGISTGLVTPPSSTLLWVVDERVREKRHYSAWPTQPHIVRLDDVNLLMVDVSVIGGRGYSAVKSPHPAKYFAVGETESRFLQTGVTVNKRRVAGTAHLYAHPDLGLVDRVFPIP